MSNFWPKDLNLEDTESPFDIIDAAKKEWNARSDGALTLVVQPTQSSGYDTLIVHAKHVPSNRTVTLFSVAHRPNSPYPAVIQPKVNELPNRLKKSFYQPGMAEVSSFSTKGYQVTNEWVCDTPAEFRSKLGSIFNLGSVKSDILNLISGTRLLGSYSGSEASNSSEEVTNFEDSELK